MDFRLGMVTEQLTELGWMEVVEPVLKRQSISAMQGPQNDGDKTELGGTLSGPQCIGSNSDQIVLTKM